MVKNSLPSSAISLHELPGPERQLSHYEVGPEFERRPHPGPGYSVCALYLYGYCNNYSYYPERLCKGDPLGELNTLAAGYGLCEECHQRRKILAERRLVKDCGGEGSPKRLAIKGDLSSILPVQPSFDEHEVRTVLFYGDHYTPRSSMGEKKHHQIELQHVDELDYNRIIYRVIEDPRSPVVFPRLMDCHKPVPAFVKDRDEAKKKAEEAKAAERAKLIAEREKAREAELAERNAKQRVADATEISLKSPDDPDEEDEAVYVSKKAPAPPEEFYNWKLVEDGAAEEGNELLSTQALAVQPGSSRVNFLEEPSEKNTGEEMKGTSTGKSVDSEKKPEQVEEGANEEGSPTSMSRLDSRALLERLLDSQRTLDLHLYKDATTLGIPKDPSSRFLKSARWLMSEADGGKIPDNCYALRLYDTSSLLMSAQDLATNVYEMYVRDCLGKVIPGLLTLVHNLDPDVVVLSGGALDICEGVEPKDVFCALKIMAEKALDVPRRKDSPWPRKIIFYGVPLTPTIHEYPNMRFRRDRVLERLRYYCESNSGCTLVPAPDVSGESCMHANFPCTEAEYRIGLEKCLDACLIKR